MEMGQRVERALRRGAALADQVTRVAEGVYHVPSQSDPDGCHVVVDLDRLDLGTGVQCDCVAAEYGNPCSHTAAVVQRRQQEEVQRLSLRPQVARYPRREVALV